MSSTNSLRYHHQPRRNNLQQHHPTLLRLQTQGSRHLHEEHARGRARRGREDPGGVQRGRRRRVSRGVWSCFSADGARVSEFGG
jgi:hypothetical protein